MQLLLFVFLFLKPVETTYYSKTIQPGIYEIHIDLHIQNEWHVYSKDNIYVNSIALAMDNDPLIKYFPVKEYGYKQLEEDSCIRMSGIGYEHNLLLIRKVITRDRKPHILRGELIIFAGNNKETYYDREEFMISLN